jgi:hypothetical protein
MRQKLCQAIQGKPTKVKIQKTQGGQCYSPTFQAHIWASQTNSNYNAANVMVCDLRCQGNPFEPCTYLVLFSFFLTP